jgi:cytosine/adenosine deaminase-related metal-dependent hydrolase
MLQGKLVAGASAMTARVALEVATRGGARCLGREGELGELSVGAVGDVAVWQLDGPIFAGVLEDPIEGWLRCGPTAARDTIVHGRSVVRDGELVSGKVEETLAAHRTTARRFQPRP